MRNLVWNPQMTASERVGNMFILLCAIHTKDGCGIFLEGLKAYRIAQTAFTDCMKLQYPQLRRAPRELPESSQRARRDVQDFMVVPRSHTY